MHGGLGYAFFKISAKEKDVWFNAPYFIHWQYAFNHCVCVFDETYGKHLDTNLLKCWCVGKYLIRILQL